MADDELRGFRVYRLVSPALDVHVHTPVEPSPSGRRHGHDPRTAPVPFVPPPGGSPARQPLARPGARRSSLSSPRPCPSVPGAVALLTNPPLAPWDVLLRAVPPHFLAPRPHASRSLGLRPRTSSDSPRCRCCPHHCRRRHRAHVPGGTVCFRPQHVGAQCPGPTRGDAATEPQPGPHLVTSSSSLVAKGLIKCFPRIVKMVFFYQSSLPSWNSGQTRLPSALGGWPGTGGRGSRSPGPCTSQLPSTGRRFCPLCPREADFPAPPLSPSLGPVVKAWVLTRSVRFNHHSHYSCRS